MRTARRYRHQPNGVQIPRSQSSVRGSSRRSGLRCESLAQVTLKEDAKQRAVITMNSNQPRHTLLCEPTVSSAREGWQQVGINGQSNHLFTPGCWRWHVVKG